MTSTTTDPTSLHRLAALPPPDALTSPHLPTSILLLSSADPAIVRLALTTLNTLMSRLGTTTKPAPNTPDSPQFYLLLGILTTTAASFLKSETTQSPNASFGEERKVIPYFLTTYAALAAEILTHPLHPLYDRICRFHTRAPRWDGDRLPSWWAHQLLYTPDDDTTTTSIVRIRVSGSGATSGEGSANAPALGTPFATSLLPQRSSSNSHDLQPPSSTSSESQPTLNPTTPIPFLLLYLYASLRSPRDLEILRARGTLEPVLALAGGAPMPRGCAGLVLALLWRCTCVEGGSTMLVTRKGIVAWLAGRIAGADEGRRGGKGQGTETGMGIMGVGGEVDVEKEGREDDAINVEGSGEHIVPSEAALMSAAGLRALLRRVWETCDRERVDKWSGGMMEGIVEDLLRSDA